MIELLFGTFRLTKMSTTIDFVPLELWRASSLSTETKQVIAAYERLLAASDFDGLLSLRTSIEVSLQVVSLNSCCI